VEKMNLKENALQLKKKYFSFVFEVYQNMIGSFWVNYMHEIKAIIIHPFSFQVSNEIHFSWLHRYYADLGFNVSFKLEKRKLV
jgi:hypothetical protein